MKNRNDMTRICSVCNMEKPLAAFLEISGTHGTRYGIICSICRGAGAAEKKLNTDEDITTTASTGNRIGLKERIFIDNEKKKQLNLQKHERIEQWVKRDALTLDKTEKKMDKEQQEKDHRLTYLDLKQSGFLGKKSPSHTPRLPIEQLFSSMVDVQSQEEKKKTQLEMNQQEEKKKTFDFAHQYIDPQAGETREHNPAFLAFQDSLEKTPFKIARERLKQLTTQHKTTPAKKQTTEKKDPLLEFVEKTWSGPSSRKR